MIIMRCTDSLDNFTLDKGNTFEETKIGRSFTLRNFQFTDPDIDSRKKAFLIDLTNLYQSEGLMLIGGVQDDGLKNNL